MTPELYIGKQKIQHHFYDEVIEMVAVKLEDNTTHEFTQEQFDSVKSEDAYDDGLVVVRKWQPALHEILQVLLKNGMTMGEKDFILERLDTSIVNNYQTAVNKLFDVKHVSLISMKSVDVVLKK